MARKTEVIVIDSGRDAGKHFLLTEMPASQAEKWAMRALLALLRGGIEVPEDVQGMGLAGIAAMGLEMLGRLPWHEAEPLLDEMLECVQSVPDPSRPEIPPRRLVESDTEDIKTRIMLRRAVLRLHIDFFTDGGLSSMVRDLVTVKPQDTSNTPTSRRKSRRS